MFVYLFTEQHFQYWKLRWALKVMLLGVIYLRKENFSRVKWAVWAYLNEGTHLPHLKSWITVVCTMSCLLFEVEISLFQASIHSFNICLFKKISVSNCSFLLHHVCARGVALNCALVSCSPEMPSAELLDMQFSRFSVGPGRSWRESISVFFFPSFFCVFMAKQEQNEEERRHFERKWWGDGWGKEWGSH